MFDFFSVLERKNPLGLIDAFTRAFRPDEGPTLVIKTINGDRRLTDLERVRAAAAGTHATSSSSTTTTRPNRRTP